MALLPSPLLGPSVWQPVGQVLTERGWHVMTGPAPVAPRTGQDVLDGLLAALPTGQDLVVIPHSNAGAYVPALVAQRQVVGCVFVDALLPPRGGRVPLAPLAFLDALRELADDIGLLPPWTRAAVELGRRLYERGQRRCIGAGFPDCDLPKTRIISCSRTALRRSTPQWTAGID